MMNIGFYAKRAAQNRTGLGNYSRFVIRILSEQFASNSYHLYTPKPHRMPYLEEIPTLKKLSLHFPPKGIWSKIRSIWRVWGMTHDIQQDGINIFHGLSNELPLNIGTPQQRETKLGEDRCKYLVTIHDLIFIHTPQYYHWIDRKIYNYKFRRACQCADRVIAVSEYTKQEIMHDYHTPEEKIDVVYQGCDPVFAQDIESSKQEEVKQKYQLPDQYVLYVGSIEGFGIPLLEAITSGIPTIGCTGSCLEEAGGPGGIYVNPDDAQSMAEAIVRTCTDEQLRQDMIKAGKTYALNFTDEKLACDLMNTYEKL